MKNINIELKDGKWLVNGNPYASMTLTEREFFHRFLDEVKISSGLLLAQPKTVKESIQQIKELVSKIDINDPVFDKPLSEIETNYEIVT